MQAHDKARDTGEQLAQFLVLVDQGPDSSPHLIQLVIATGFVELYARLEVLDVLLLALPEFALGDSVLHFPLVLQHSRYLVRPPEDQ